MGADAGIIQRAVPELGDMSLMLLGVIEGLVVVDDREQGDLVVGGGPEGACRHEQVAVGLNIDTNLAARGGFVFPSFSVSCRQSRVNSGNATDVSALMGTSTASRPW